MKEIKAYVRVEYIDRIIHALRGVGIENVSVSHVKAIGSSIDPIDSRISVELSILYEKMVKLEIACYSERAEEIMSIIQRA